MRDKDFDIYKIAEHLQGTCTNTLDSAIETLYPGMTWNDLTAEDFDTLDNEVFECSGCGWWCESSEEAEDSGDGERYCNDCHNAEEDD